MDIILFLVVLAVLIFSHELGHFIAAKRAGMRVDEFGLGFPPRLFSKKKGETVYSVNMIPFGGFVRIFGENPKDVDPNSADIKRSFGARSKPWQAVVLVAGVTFNMILAWLLISISFMAGTPVSTTDFPATTFEDEQLMVLGVLPDSPAEEAGFKAGEVITGLSAGGEVLSEITPESVQQFVISHGNEEIAVQINGSNQVRAILPAEGIVEGQVAIGVSMDLVGTAKLPVHQALWTGARYTGHFTVATAAGLFNFFKELLIGERDGALAQVVGPVGLVGLVGEASALGLVHLLIFTAIISINLAIINLIPFPALDGGRLLFLIIEAIKGKPMSPQVAGTLNLLGFAILMFLMVLVTYRDILNF